MGERGIGPSVCSLAPAQPSSGIQPGQGVNVPDHNLAQLLCDLLMSRQGHSPEHLLLSYISIRKKKKELKTL